MSSEVLEMYEALDEVERFEVDSLIQRFVAAKAEVPLKQVRGGTGSRKDTSFIDEACGCISHEMAESLRQCCGLHFKEI